MPADELYAPLAYSWWWPAVAVLALVLAVVWVVVVLVTTRRRAGEDEDAPEPSGPTVRPGAADPYATIRPVYLARIDDVARRHESGDLDLRGLHLALSAVVRDFGTVRRGADTSVLTLTDLRRTYGAGPLAELIETYYRPTFARDGEVDARAPEAIERARQVVRRW